MHLIEFVVITFLYAFHRAGGVEIQSVKLIGGADNYINIHSTSSYSMQCNFRSGYDDPVKQVKWYKDGKLVYMWNMKSPVSSATGNLAGRVITNDQENLQNIYFQKPNLEIGGTYVCEVASQNNTVRSEPFLLSVVDISSDAYSTSVNLVESVSLGHNDTMEKAKQNCTLQWQFHTPAIYPRPNVTCGFYSYLHDDVTEELPAGLTMHRLQNGSWLAGFDHTMVEISDVPRESRLGCSVKISGTSYNKVVKFEDSFKIDHLIDSQGCPTKDFDASKNLKATWDGSIINCRGDLVPLSTSDPVKVHFSCSPGQFALFPNGTSVNNWSADLQCNTASMEWTPSSPSSPGNFTELPSCISGWATAGARSSTFMPFWLMISICVIIFK